MANRPLEPKIEKNVLSMPVEHFIRHRDSVITGLTTLIGNINDFNRAFIDETNRILGGSIAGAENSYAITNYMQTANNLSSGLTGLVNADGKLRKKRVKKEVDPDAPKRPLTAYFLFAKTARGIVKNDLGEDAPSNDVQNEVLRRWNNMDQAEKQKWKDEYERNSAVYKEEVAEYKRTKDIPHDEEILADALPGAEAAAQDSSDDDDDDSSSSEDEPAPPPPPPPPPPKATKGGKKKGKENGVAAPPPAALRSPSPSAQLMKETPIPFPGVEAKAGKVDKRKRVKDDSPTETKKPRTGKAAAEEVVASTETPAAVTDKPEKKERRKKRKSELA